MLIAACAVQCSPLIKLCLGSRADCVLSVSRYNGTILHRNHKKIMFIFIL